MSRMTEPKGCSEDQTPVAGRRKGKSVNYGRRSRAVNSHRVRERQSLRPSYETQLGRAYSADASALLSTLPTDSVDLVVTSPPYALHFKKEYGNVAKQDYVEWFIPFAREIYRSLKPTGSFVLNIGGSYNPRSPSRSLYHFKLLIALVEEVGFHLAQECFWYNPAKLPAPAEWVTVRRQRIKDSVEYVWWFGKNAWPQADNRNVLVPYSPDMERLIKRGYRAKLRPSGHNITHKFQVDRGGAIPSNVIERGNNESNSEYIKACNKAGVKVHPARFPAALPEFFIKLCSRPGDLIVDPFAGSNTTGYVAETLGRHWITSDINSEYVQASRLRFQNKEASSDQRRASRDAQSSLLLEPLA